ncbi:hypothetical protein PoB_004787300 [Plakobranchus ocellatus]|uniref:Uncharacterized protein n=1 Tax=Plakobranchus ocellatus TaxID=259542 RepID=A0AAV4BP62_9GAST|nr:hypothetical protein PoB_004787300 [Plakobranchus ocellatus]
MFGLIARTKVRFGFCIKPVHKKVIWFGLVFGYSQSTTRDPRLSGPPSGQGAGGGARTRDRKVPADLRADSLATVPPTHHKKVILGPTSGQGAGSGARTRNRRVPVDLRADSLTTKQSKERRHKDEFKDKN